LARFSLTAEGVNVSTPPDVFNGFQARFAALPANKSIDTIATESTVGGKSRRLREK